MSNSTAKSGLDVYSAELENRLLSFLDKEIQEWNRIDESVVYPLESLKTFISNGGKRIRPAFCYLGFLGSNNKEITDDILDLGCALELLHTFAIIHDDIMDRADTRRGKPTVHRYLENIYNKENYLGDIEHFAMSVAILTGDFAFTYADKFTRNLPSRCLDIYDILKTELFAGQQMDLDAVYKAEISKENISRIAQYKSGKYTIERPLHLGALLTDENADLSKWSAFGSPLGEAFQLRDDVLGIFGNSDQTGKPVGDDLREGKFTLLIAEALERANEDEKALLDLRGKNDLTSDEIVAMVNVVESVGALKAVEERIQELYDESMIALEKLDLPVNAQDYALYLADYVCWRDQ